jgi:hypothetical protein
VDSENYRPEWWDSEHAPGGNYLSNGTELYPRVLRDAVEVVRDDYGVDVPIYITENGTSADADPDPHGQVRDAERIDYLHALLTEALDAQRPVSTSAATTRGASSTTTSGEPGTPCGTGWSEPRHRSSIAP